MANNHSLGKLTILYTAGNLASKVITFGLFFFYTFFLSKEDLGAFDLIISTLSLLSPLISFQIYDALLRWLLNDKDVPAERVILSSLVLIGFNMLFIAVVGIIWGLFFDVKHWQLICLLTILNTAYPIFQYTARGTGFNSAYVISGVLYSIIFTVSTLTSLYFFNLKIDGLLISNIIAVLISCLYLAFKIDLPKYIFLKNFDRVLLTKMIRFSLPLIPNTLGWWAISMANRYIIVFYLGVAANGLFAVGMKFPSILLMLTNIFYMAWQEKAIRTYDSVDRDEYYTGVFQKYLSLLFSLLAVLIAVTKPALRFLVQESYYDAWKFLPYLYIAIGYQALSSFFGTGYLSSKDTAGAFTTTVFGAISTVLSSFLLIPLYGLVGASLAILIGYLVLFATRVQQTKKYFTIDIPTKKMLTVNLIIIAVSIITLTENIFVLILNVFLSIILAILLNFIVIKEYSQKLRLQKAQ